MRALTPEVDRIARPRRHAERMKLLVREQRAAVASCASVLDEDDQARARVVVEGARVACEEAIERRGARRELSFVGLERLAHVGGDAIDRVAIVLGHGLPRRIAGSAPRRKAAGGGERRERTEDPLIVRRVEEGDGVGHLEAGEVHLQGVLERDERLRPE